MATVYVLLFVVAAGVAVVVAATVVVVIGVRQEERHRTIAHRCSPTIAALLARRVLGTYLLPLLGYRPGDQ
jgi:hypothetical protein